MVFIETPTFAAERETYLPDTIFRELQQALADDPELGDLIPGGKGLRKFVGRCLVEESAVEPE